MKITLFMQATSFLIYFSVSIHYKILFFSVKCDFEDEDLCNYSLQKGIGNWEWLTSSEPNISYPLPPNDHTELTSTGNIMLIN